MISAFSRWIPDRFCVIEDDEEWEDEEEDSDSEDGASDASEATEEADTKQGAPPKPRTAPTLTTSKEVLKRSSTKRSPLEGIWLGGKRSLIMNELLELAFVKVDCRRFSGGRFRDKRAQSVEAMRRNMGALRELASQIHAAREAGKSIYVHCSQGINRSPASLTAYLLLHCPEVQSLEAAFSLIREIRAIANTDANTFYPELVMLCREQGKMVVERGKLRSGF